MSFRYRIRPPIAIGEFVNLLDILSNCTHDLYSVLNDQILVGSVQELSIVYENTIQCPHFVVNLEPPMSFGVFPMNVWMEDTGILPTLR